MNIGRHMLLAALLFGAASLGAANAGQQTYDGKCLKCHGAEGNGQGRVGKLLNPKPTDFTSAEWQSKTSDETVVEAITNGSQSTKLKIGKKMTEFGSKLSKEQILSLVKVIRGFKKPAGK